MDTVTYPEPRVADFIMQHFVPVQVRVKQHPDLVDAYLVSWTPNVVIADEKGRVHYRVEGYIAPDDCVARLSLGLGKLCLNRKKLPEAKQRFEEVAQRHSGTGAGAEALYWLGVAEYKESHDGARLRTHWARLVREYPGSEWTRRSQVPATQ